MQATITDTKTASFWDKTAPKYARRPVADPAAYEAKLTRVRALLRSTDRVLEIGCGTGSTALKLAPHAAKVTATDISGGMLAIAERKRAEAQVANVTFQEAPAHEPLDAAPFDVVMAFSLLHLVDDVPEALNAVFAQTKPGGLFLSKTVCLGEANVALRFLVHALHVIGYAPKVAMLTRQDLEHALVAAGFDLLETQYFGKGRLNPFIIAKRPA